MKKRSQFFFILNSFIHIHVAPYSYFICKYYFHHLITYKIFIYLKYYGYKSSFYVSQSNNTMQYNDLSHFEPDYGFIENVKQLCCSHFLLLCLLVRLPFKHVHYVTSIGNMQNSYHLYHIYVVAPFKTKLKADLRITRSPHMIHDA